MPWHDDSGGIHYPQETKLFLGYHPWAMKLAQLAHTKGVVLILTYSLPGLDYIADTLKKRPSNIRLICNSQFRRDAEQLKGWFPRIDIAVLDHLHAKMVAIYPKTVYIGSDNFGKASGHEMTIGTRSRSMYIAACEHFHHLWRMSAVL